MFKRYAINGMDAYEDMKYHHGDKRLNSRRNIVVRFSSERTIEQIQNDLNTKIFKFYASEEYPRKINAEIRNGELIIRGSKGAEITLSVNDGEITLTGKKKKLTFKDLETIRAITQIIEPNASIKIITAGKNTRRVFTTLSAGNQPIIETIGEKGFAVRHKPPLGFFGKIRKKITEYYTDSIAPKYFTEGEIVAHFRSVNKKKKTKASKVFLDKLLEKRRKDPDWVSRFQGVELQSLYTEIMHEAYFEYIDYLIEGKHSEKEILRLGEKYKHDLCALFTDKLNHRLRKPQNAFGQSVEDKVKLKLSSMSMESTENVQDKHKNIQGKKVKFKLLNDEPSGAALSLLGIEMVDNECTLNVGGKSVTFKMNANQPVPIFIMHDNKTIGEISSYGTYFLEKIRDIIDITLYSDAVSNENLKLISDMAKKMECVRRSPAEFVMIESKNEAAKKRAELVMKGGGAQRKGLIYHKLKEEPSPKPSSSKRSSSRRFI